MSKHAHNTFWIKLFFPITSDTKKSLIKNENKKYRLESINLPNL